MQILLAVVAMSKNTIVRPTAGEPRIRRRGAVEPAAKFDKFAQDIRGFEKTIYELVASSFVFSAIGAAVHAGLAKSDPGIVATALLIGTVGGIGGILVTYLGAARHPADVVEERRRFRTAPHVWRIGASLLISIGMFFLFFYYSRFDPVLSLIALPFATYFFFRGLVTGFLDVHKLEAQEREWDLMTVDERLKSIRQEDEYRKNAAELGELAAEGTSIIASVRRNRRDQLRRSRQQARWNFIKSKLQAFRMATIDLRHRIAGRWLLLPSEERERITAGAMFKLEHNHLDQELRFNLKEDVLERIENGQLKPAKLEGFDIDLFRDGTHSYFFVRETLNEFAAQRFLAAFDRYRDPKTRKLNTFHGFMDDQSEKLVERHGSTEG